MAQKTTLTKKTAALSSELFKLNFDSEKSILGVLNILHTYIKFEAATCYLYDRKSDQLKSMYSMNQEVNLLESLAADYGVGLSAWSADSAHSILITDRTKKKDYNPDEDFASFLSVPIIHNGILYGVFNFGSYTKERFTKEHAEIVESVTDILSLYLQIANNAIKVRSLESALTIAKDQIQKVNNQLLNNATVDTISTGTSEVIHGINNSLSIILGNLQCILIGKNDFNQKTLSRLKRIETAAKKISDSNHQILHLNSLVDRDTTDQKTEKVS